MTTIVINKPHKLFIDSEEFTVDVRPEALRRFINARGDDEIDKAGTVYNQINELWDAPEELRLLEIIKKTEKK